jgi:hypothetical protein
MTFRKQGPAFSDPSGIVADMTLGRQLRYNKMSPSLSVVANNDLKVEHQKPETVAQRVRRLQAEARALAKDHVATFAAAMTDLGQLAHEISEGGDAYAPGIRDLARRLAEELDARAHTVQAIAAKT